MIRFVDLRYQGIGYRFAFWDTVTDTFISLDSQAWDTFYDFESEYNDRLYKLQGIDRFKSLCPDWVFKRSTNEDEMYGIKRLGFFSEDGGGLIIGTLAEVKEEQ